MISRGGFEATTDFSSATNPFSIFPGSGDRVFSLRCLIRSQPSGTPMAPVLGAGASAFFASAFTCRNGRLFQLSLFGNRGFGLFNILWTRCLRRRFQRSSLSSPPHFEPTPFQTSSPRKEGKASVGPLSGDTPSIGIILVR